MYRCLLHSQNLLQDIAHAGRMIGEFEENWYNRDFVLEKVQF